MSRKFIFTIQFILVCILCIGCNTKASTPNRREAQLIELSSEEVSLDASNIITLLINKEIHIIDVNYYEIVQFNILSENKKIFFIGTQGFTSQTKKYSYIETAGIVVEYTNTFLFVM